MAVTGAKRQRGPGRPFQKGKSGNPRGRLPGTRNHATVIAEKRFEGAIESICATVISKACEGDMTAATLVIERLIPARRDNPINFNLPKVASSADAETASAAILAAVAAAEITPIEANDVARLVDGHVKVIEAASFEARLAEVEKKLDHAARSEKEASGSRAESLPS